MEIDLSHRSISELRFDRAQSSEEEVLVASRVQSLNACNNRIECILGLGALFNHLAHLDLAHNRLGSRSGPDACTWLDALPSSLCVLILAHNELCTFTTNEVVVGGGKNGSKSNGTAVSAAPTASVGMEMSLGRLRLACPTTLALFFNRKRFPHLRELDLSYNALSLTVDESDIVEEVWEEVVERPIAARAFSKEDKAMWLQCTTSAVTVLQLDGNEHLSAFNGVLCGMEALTYLRAADCGVSDLTALSAAATFCPRLHRLDMHGNPVVEAFVHAPRKTLANFLELLLLPSILSDCGVDDRRGDWKEEEECEKRSALQRVVREVAQKHIEQIEATLSCQEGSGCNTLAGVIYAALLQQVIPQVAELDGGVDVNAAREGLMSAAREVLKRVIENIDRSTTQAGDTNNFRCGMSSQITPSPGGDQRAHRQEQPRRIASDGSMDTSRNSLQAQRRDSGAVEKRSRKMVPVSEGLTETDPRTERSRSAQGMMMRAAAVAAQLRPAVRVTGSAPTNVTTISSRGNASSGARAHSGAEMENRFSGQFGRDHDSATGTSSMNASNGSNRGANGSDSSVLQDKSKSSCDERKDDASRVFHSSTATAARTKSDSSSFCEASGKESRFQRALAALTPMLMQRLRGEGLPIHSASASDQTRFSMEDRDTSTFSTGTSTSNALAAREALLQQAQALEKALLASRDRQRGMQEAVSLLKEQLQKDRRLIVDQRKEAARLRQELDLLVESNKSTARRIKKRQKEIAYGAAALRRQEEVAQRKAALEYIEREEKSLRQAERRLREKMALSGVCSHAHVTDSAGRVQATTAINGIERRPPRKTHADLLRENAVRERMAAMRQTDVFSYSPRKFRLSDYGLNGGDGRSNSWTNGTGVNPQAERHQPPRGEKSGAGSVDTGAEEKPACGNTPWCKGRNDSSSSSQSTSSTRGAEREENGPQSMYEKGFSPYSAVEKSGGWSDDEGNKYLHGSLQGLSLQQLFEEAAAIQHRQRILHQRMSGAPNDVRNDADPLNVELEERALMFNDEKHHDGDDVNPAFDTHTPPMCMGGVQGASGGSTSCVTANDSSWSGIDNKTQNSGLRAENNSDSDDEDSVDVVVSLAEGQLNGDFLVATMPPPPPPPSSSFAPERTRKFTEDPKWHTTEPHRHHRGEDECLVPPHGAAGGHFSMDARRIYAEILRQRQEHEEQQRKQEASRQQEREERIKTGGVKLEEKERAEGEEPSSVSSELRGPSSTENGNTVNEEGAAEDTSACASHVDKNDNRDTATRRALFT